MMKLQPLSHVPAPGALPKSRREQAVDAAAHVFARFGYHGAGTRAIAEVLGIKVASLYSYFRSKDEALEEVCRAGLQQPLAYLREACALETSFERRIRHFFTAHRENLDVHCDYLSVFMNERRYLTKAATSRLNKLARETSAAFDAMFISAQEEGAMDKALTLRMARLITIGVLRNITQFYFEGPIANFDTFVKESTDHFLRGVADPQRPPLPGPGSAAPPPANLYTARAPRDPADSTEPGDRS